MKKKFVFVGILLLLLLSAGCTKENTPSNTPIPNSKVIINERTGAAPTPEAENIENPTISPPKPPVSPTPTQGTSKKDAFIAESDNIVSSSEKEAILNEVDKLLDDVLQNINDLEEVKSNDLDENEQ